MFKLDCCRGRGEVASIGVGRVSSFRLRVEGVDIMGWGLCGRRESNGGVGGADWARGRFLLLEGGVESGGVSS